MKFCQPHWDRLRAEIRSHGVTDFIAKPIQVDRLYAALERALAPPAAPSAETAAA